MRDGRGWHLEPDRHSLSARGIKTTPGRLPVRGISTTPRPDIKELHEEALWITDPQWTCVLEEDDIHLGLYVEMIDMREYDPDYDEDEYPVMINISIMVIPEEASPEFMDAVRSGGSGEIELDVDDMYSYAGGVPATTFMEGISGVESAVPSIIKEDRRGLKNRFFRSHEDAEQYAKEVYAHNAWAMFTLVGFLLDQRVNLMGNDGCDIIRFQKENESYLVKW